MCRCCGGSAFGAVMWRPGERSFPPLWEARGSCCRCCQQEPHAGSSPGAQRARKRQDKGALRPKPRLRRCQGCETPALGWLIHLGPCCPRWSQRISTRQAHPTLPLEPVFLTALCIGKQGAVLQKEHHGGGPTSDSACLDTGCTRGTCSRMLLPVI